MKRLLFSVVLVACGKSTPPPVVATPEPAADASISSPLATVDASSPAPLADTTPDAGAPTPAAKSDAPPEPQDECPPAAAALETGARVAMRKCYEDGAKKKPGLAGSVRIAVNVDQHGKISSTKSMEKSTLGDKVVECISKAIKATPFDSGKCTMRALQIMHAYP